MKNKYIFQTKAIHGVALFYMYLNLSNVCNNRDNWTLLSASTFNLLHYAFLVEVYEENWASQSFVFEKDMKSPLKGLGIPCSLRLCFENHCS